MKTVLSVIFSVFILLAGCKNFFVIVDYNVNRNFYEARCENKAKPEMQCHGKCQMKKEAEKTAPQNELVKISFEFNILPNKNLEIPKPTIKISEIKNEIFYTSIEKIQKGFYQILPHPPQDLVYTKTLVENNLFQI